MANDQDNKGRGDETVIIRPGAAGQGQGGAKSPTAPFAPGMEPTKIIRSDGGAAAPAGGAGAAPDISQTRILRSGTPSPEAPTPAIGQGGAEIEPVVGWLAVVKGHGKGAFRPIFHGNNTIGRDASQRIPLDFGDDAISAQDQAYIQYDYEERVYRFIPNMAKSNIVAVNQAKPTAAVPLNAGDIIRVGETHLRFVPLCGADFDWSDTDV